MAPRPSTNRFTAIGPVTPTYDSNGNLTSDGVYNYTWDGEGNLATLNSNAETYDALDRRVEQYSGSAYTEIVYGPRGNKMALMSGQTVTKVFTPLSAGATAVYNSSGLSYYRHPDWLGSSRVASTTSRTIYYDGAYAPYGENYAGTGTTDPNFTGQNQDMATGLYDFPYREYHPTQGRWVSPDPAGPAAVDPTNPQSWNRYGYGLNNPCGVVDPMGLANCTLKIYANNQAGVNLNTVGSQINALLGSVASPSGDTVGAVFVPASQANYTVNFVNGNPDGNYGFTPSFLGLFSFGSSTVNAAAVGKVFGNSPQAVEDAAMGTIAAHELTHLIANIPDLPYGDSFPVQPNLMQVDNVGEQDPIWFARLFYQPLGFPPSPAQVAALYNQCKLRQDQNHLAGGGMGSGSGFGTYDMQGLLCLFQGCTPYPNSPDCPNGDCKP
jgi:RHS repeat-associated protein